MQIAVLCWNSFYFWPGPSTNLLYYIMLFAMASSRYGAVSQFKLLALVQWHHWHARTHSNISTRAVCADDVVTCSLELETWRCNSSLQWQLPLQQVDALDQGSCRSAEHTASPARSSWRWRGQRSWSAWRLTPPHLPAILPRRSHDIGRNIIKSIISYG